MLPVEAMPLTLVWAVNVQNYTILPDTLFKPLFGQADSAKMTELCKL
jgi:hypothetical protein